MLYSELNILFSHYSKINNNLIKQNKNLKIMTKRIIIKIKINKNNWCHKEKILSVKQKKIIIVITPLI